MKICKICNTANKNEATNCSKCGTTITNENMQNFVYDTGTGGTTKKQMSILGIGSAALVILGAILPYASVMGAKVALIKGSVGIVLVLVGVLALLCALRSIGIGMLLGGIVSFAIFFSRMLRWQDSGLTSGWGALLVHKEMGYYCLLVGSVLLLIAGVGAISKKVRNRN